MRANFILASGAAWVLLLLLWSSPAGALSPETACENAKLRAAGAYARCLARAAKDANAKGGALANAAVGRCDERFDRMFERAEANGACRTAGGPATLRGPILGQMEDTFATTTTGPGCPSTPSLDQDTSTYTCTLKSGSAVDLAAIVTQIGSADVTDDSVVWIEAWGANGGPGNTSNGGPGGNGGYAQITTTVNDLLLFFGISEYHYYLGVNGAGPSANAGGDGGTATLVTVNDLTSESANLDHTLMVAGGGGGGGGGRGEASACSEDRFVLGGAGGNGGAAISPLHTDFFGTGGVGGEQRNTNESGSGGGGDSNGSGGAVKGGNAEVGGDGFAALGGAGGNRNDPTTGFFNQSGVKISLSGGRGGSPGDDAGGGGGGGGYGGGGGGRRGEGDTDCVSGGGGGGGSLARVSTQTCTRSRPSGNPGGTRGAVQIVFDAGSCG